MEIDFIKINGTNQYLDYNNFKQSIIDKLNITCNKVEVIILNNFPVPVLAQANIDLLILFRIPKEDKNYYKIKIGQDHTYLHNLILAVSIIKDYQNDKIEINRSSLTVNSDTLIDYSETAVKLKWALTNYLADSCHYDRRKITVHPMFWVINKSCLLGRHIVSTKSLTFENIENCIAQNSYIKYPGYGDWNNLDLVFEGAIKNIFEQASKDSKSGFITKKKIERIQSKFNDRLKKADDNIGEKFVEIKGKAGTGKTSDLLKCMLNLSLKNQRATFLTYNHILVYDITSQIKSFENQLSEDERCNKGPTTASTLHSFFYNLAKKLGVLMLMSEKRINELMNTLNWRINRIEKYFDQIRLTEPEISLAKLKFYLQNAPELDEGTKRQALDLIKHIQEETKFLKPKKDIRVLIDSFITKRFNQVSNLQNSNIFISDYHHVLKNIFDALFNIDGFINNFDITSKFELLENTMNLDPAKMLNESGGKMDPIKLKQRYLKGIAGFKAGRVLFVDEAQDCHPLERDILFILFGTENIAIANGDKEQLVRYSHVCDWHISRSVKIDFYRYSKKAKSFRMKPAIAALANHIAKSFKIDLGILPLDTEDHGTISINNHTSDNLSERVDYLQKLHNQGYRQGCSSYESLLLLFPPGMNNSLNLYQPNMDGISNSNQAPKIVINEFNVIKDSRLKVRSEPTLITEARNKIDDFRFWNTTGNVDKRELSVPGSLSVRSIYYESCRGIEAWSTMCIGLDKFFDHKKNEDEAENYLLGSHTQLLSPDERKNMYAATWVLMAITRAMDSCYIEYSNNASPIVNVIKEFENMNPNYVSYVS